MARYRFSIRGLMIVIVVLALAFTALRTPSRLWANAWFTLALGGVTIAIPAAVANVGDRRAFWIGFAVCGWVYFIFSLAPWVDKEASHQLFTTTILDLASPYIINNQYMSANYMNAFAPPEAPGSPRPGRSGTCRTSRPRGAGAWVMRGSTVRSFTLGLATVPSAC